MLLRAKEDEKIPRYALPGLVRTKAIYMSDMIAKLAAEFSREKTFLKENYGSCIGRILIKIWLKKRGRNTT